MSTDNGQQTSRTRSPAYPNISLKKAVERVRQLHKEVKRNLVHVDAVMGFWKYDGKSSNGMRTLAALKQFGLLSEEGKKDNRQVKLSPLAYNILMPEQPESEAYYRDLQTAALLPTLHHDVWEHYSGDLPSDAAIHRYLVLEKNFNEDFVDRFISQFRSTVAFAKLSSEDIIGNEDGDESDTETDTPLQTSLKKEKSVSAQTPTAGNAIVRDFPIPLISGGLAVVKVPVPMTQADFDQITGTLEAWKTALVRQPKTEDKQRSAIAPPPGEDVAEEDAV